MVEVLIAGISFASAFIQNLAGFGFALLAMPLISQLLGIRVAAPLVALMSLIANALGVLHYREAFNLRAIGPLALASFVGIPLGVLAVHYVNEELILKSLGVVVIGYALYVLANLHLPPLKRTLWAYSFGLLAGLLSGAFNTPGPAAVIYGDWCRWERAKFRCNLQVLFLLNNIVVMAVRALNGDYAVFDWKNFLWAIPAILVGFVVGASLDRFINQTVFRRIVLVLLVAVGLNLLR